MVVDNRRGYRQVVDGFWADARRDGIALPQSEPVSAAAFCKARRKLTPAAMRDLLIHTGDGFARNFGQRYRIKGRRILAVDSSKLTLQRANELFEFFGAPKNGPTPQATVNVLYDVVARIPIDATIEPYANDEREQLLRLLEQVKPGDVLVIDQGYPSYELIHELLKRGVHFVMRMVTNSGFSQVQDFLRSGGRDRRVRFEKPKGRAREFEPCDLRLVRNTNPPGQQQVFVTSLPKSEFSRAAILDLYRRRWEIELLFREQKNEAIGQRQFHARSVLGVKQEIYAMYLYFAITRTILAAAIGDRDVGDRYIPQRNAFFKLADVFTELLLSQELRDAKATLNRLLQALRRSLETRRRSRAYPRRSFKPPSRWGLTGKR